LRGAVLEDIMKALENANKVESPIGAALIDLYQTSDGLYQLGQQNVSAIQTSRDGKVEFVSINGKTIAHVKSAMGYPAYYPVHSVEIKRPIKAVLMDLDGTSVKSEAFWMWIIEKTMASLLKEPTFELEEVDTPFVSGHSVSEHLKYCIDKYCPGQSVEDARALYFEHTRLEMNDILNGGGKENAFTPTEGLKPFLLELKAMGIKIGLVTSGLYEKAWPEIVSAFRTLDMGDPEDFYDSVISAGFPLRKGEAGTLGELCPKPHPWLYAEICRIGLGIDFEDREHVIGIEDSGAGLTSIRLAGFNAIGISGGNIVESGMKGLCHYYCHDFDEILKIIKGESIQHG
jgi:beta-phosphoglucomutase